MAELTQERLKQVLHYDPRTGVFTRIARLGSRGVVGTTAGSVDKYGYWKTMIDGKHHKLHRLAFLYMTGNWPEHEVDHIDTDKSNNSWKNLRDSTHRQNMANRGITSSNTSGFKGVRPERGRFRANIRVNGTIKFLGYFDTPEEASAAYVSAANDLHGEFARTG